MGGLIDLLSVIVSGNKLTEEEMVENMMTIIGAGLVPRL